MFGRNLPNFTNVSGGGGTGAQGAQGEPGVPTFHGFSVYLPANQDPYSPLSSIFPWSTAASSMYYNDGMLDLASGIMEIPVTGHWQFDFQIAAGRSTTEAATEVENFFEIYNGTTMEVVAYTTFFPQENTSDTLMYGFANGSIQVFLTAGDIVYGRVNSPVAPSPEEVTIIFAVSPDLSADDRLTYWSAHLIEGTLGAQGETGAQGAQGGTGAQGAQGEVGAQGESGAQGAQGDAGPQGSQGVQGEAGAQGAQGETGAQGVQGETGAQGVGAVSFEGFSVLKSGQITDYTSFDPIDGWGIGTLGYNIGGMLDLTTGIATIPTTGHWEIDFSITARTAATPDGSNHFIALVGGLGPTIIAQVQELSASPIGSGNYINTFQASGAAYFTVGDQVYIAGVINGSGAGNGFILESQVTSWSMSLLEGIEGAQGAQGETGAQGDTGAQGETGAQGAQGETGAQGVPGPPGQPTFDGFSVYLASTIDPYTPGTAIGGWGATATGMYYNDNSLINLATGIVTIAQTGHYNIEYSIKSNGDSTLDFYFDIFNSTTANFIAFCPTTIHFDGNAGQDVGYCVGSAAAYLQAGDQIYCRMNGGVSKIYGSGNPKFTYWSMSLIEGEMGPQGDQGVQGVVGPQGAQGETGAQGVSGTPTQGFSVRLSGTINDYTFFTPIDGWTIGGFGYNIDTMLDTTTGVVTIPTTGHWEVDFAVTAETSGTPSAANFIALSTPALNYIATIYEESSVANLNTFAISGSAYFTAGDQVFLTGNINGSNTGNGVITAGTRTFWSMNLLEGVAGAQGEAGPQGAQGAQGEPGAASVFTLTGSTGITLSPSPWDPAVAPATISNALVGTFGTGCLLNITAASRAGGAAITYDLAQFNDGYIVLPSGTITLAAVGTYHLDFQMYCVLVGGDPQGVNFSGVVSGFLTQLAFPAYSVTYNGITYYLVQGSISFRTTAINTNVTAVVNSACISLSALAASTGGSYCSITRLA